MDLKPCPFCGSSQIDEAMTRGYEGGDTEKPIIAAGCWKCGCTGPSISVPKNKNGYKESIEAWNKRVKES